jgi:hypothetical protein
MALVGAVSATIPLGSAALVLIPLYIAIFLALSGKEVHAIALIVLVACLAVGFVVLLAIASLR